MKATAATVEQRVLLLPATRRDGEVIAALLQRQRIRCHVCHSAGEAAAAFGDEVGMLMLTDQMVGDPNSHLLTAALGSQPAWSDLPVVFLSKAGAESLEMADLVGRMTNVTLLDRPASTRTMLSAIQVALRSRSKQYQLRDHLASLQSAQSQLRQLDRRKDEFLAMLAHELRNPLAPIRTAIDVLPRLISAGDARAQSTVGVVHRQVAQLTRLVDDLLDVSRITQGRIEITCSTVELASVISQALESVQPLMGEKKHTVACSAAPGLYVNGDRARLVQCVSNVLINAAKYTDPGGRIAIEVSGDEQWAVVSVADTGIGIPEELLPRIFELFVQDARSLDRSQGGLGIGLCVVRRLVELHGGEVHAASLGAGQGSTFRIFLPRAGTVAHAGSADARSKTRAGLKVLVVDDNQDAADSLAMLLSLEGHVVQTAYDPQEAMALTPAFAPHVILLDIGLPGMDGYEVARLLRAKGSQARLVALSGYGQRQDVDRALSAGMDEHLVKPVEWEKLAAALHRVPRPATGG